MVAAFKLADAPEQPAPRRVAQTAPRAPAAPARHNAAAAPRKVAAIARPGGDWKEF
jgi:hypothetical protein